MEHQLLHSKPHRVGPAEQVSELPHPRTGGADRVRHRAQMQIAGKDGGSKLIEVRRLAAQGHTVTVIGERQFWRLAESTARARGKGRKKGTSKARR